MPAQVTFGRSTDQWLLGDLIVTRTLHASGLVLSS